METPTKSGKDIF